MTQELDLADIQGNILQDFVSGYPTARFIFLNVPSPEQGRTFVREYRKKVTTALRWNHSGAYAAEIKATKPRVAINLAISYAGFRALGLPTRTLARMPPEFMDGMKARAEILGGKEEEKTKADWDAAWRGEVHLMVGLNALLDPQAGAPVADLDAETQYLKDLCARCGLVMVGGHGKDNLPWQEAITVLAKDKATYKPVPIEHFGFIDGISNPVFEGQFGDAHADAAMAIGNGKIVSAKPDDPKSETSRWAPVATGEFLLGHPDEAQETADCSAPGEVLRNGTFLVYRKLHENVGKFRAFVAKAAEGYARVTNMPVEDAAQILMAKMAGRWSDGVPTAVAPTIAEWRAFNAKYAGRDDDRPYVDFAYGDDPEGLKCPVTSHMRRTNPRDNFEGISALNNRRRILRRGIPYGRTSTDDSEEHGIIFLAMCASLSRQYEFVQQQWVNYGLDANAGNDTCPLVGNRTGDAKFVLPVDPEGGEAPFIWNDIPKFVEMRGGEYFFLPSMTALRMIGMGTVDPT
jgi:Dyp-type peroxidase family